MRPCAIGFTASLIVLLAPGCRDAKRPSAPTAAPSLEQVLKTLLQDPDAFQSTDPAVKERGEPVEPFVGAGAIGIDLIRRHWPEMCVTDARIIGNGGPPTKPSKETNARMRLLGTVLYVGFRANGDSTVEAAIVSALLEVAKVDPNSILRSHALLTLRFFPLRNRQHLKTIASLLHDGAPSSETGCFVWQDAETILERFVSDETRPANFRKSQWPPIPRLWNDWLEQNFDYLYCSEGETQFRVSAEAKAAGLPANPVTGKPIR